MLSILLSLLSFHNVLSSTDADWTYTKQNAWGEMSGSYCGSNYKTQSPIAISSSQANTQCLDVENKLDWQLVKDVPKFLVTNKGNIHVKLSTADGQGSNDAFGKLKNNFKDAYNSEHGDYCLDSLHIHWASEHTIDNQRSKLEIHFVHFSCEYDTIEEALAATPNDPYVLAVIGVLYEIGEENKFLKEITDRIGSIKTHGQSIEITTSNNNGITMLDLVPEIKDNSEYYHYLGSLTTPLCNPVVSWHVLKDKKTVSSDQISKLATMLDADGHLVNDIYRDAQINENTVYHCPKTTN